MSEEQRKAMLAFRLFDRSPAPDAMPRGVAVPQSVQAMTPASHEPASQDWAARDRERILDALSEPVVLLTAHRRIAYLNPAAAEAFGRDLVGRNVARAVRQPDAIEAVEAVMAGARRAEATLTIGQPAPVTWRLVVVALDAGGTGERERAAAALSFTDVSHVVRAEAMRSDFVANVSHELRSPLTSLTGFIETLGGAARDDAAARERFLGIMAKEAGRMERLIDDLLSLSRVEADERVRPREPLDVALVVGHVVAVLRPKAEARDQSIVIDSSLAEAVDTSLSEAKVRGDADQMGQVFHNLVENALKYSAPGSEVRVGLSRERASGFRDEVLRVDVRDRGEGIAAEHLPRLTERFYRVDTGRSRAEGGTGLGLAIVKHIVNRHRGRLSIASKPGEGSTFTVRLPLL